MPQLDVWLIRHAESTINAGEWSSEPHAAALTEQGRQQAAELSKKILQQPDLIVLSPFKRTHDTANGIKARWPAVPVEIWPIQEFTYLDPAKCGNTTVLERRALIDNYWQRLDPFYGEPHAESFADFVQRVKEFSQRLVKQNGFIVVVSHRRFIKAYQMEQQQKLVISPTGMQLFREIDAAQPIANCEISKLIFNEANNHS